MAFTGERSRSRPWLIASTVAIGWALFTMIVLHLISSRDPVFDTLSSYPEYPDPVSGEIHLYSCLIAFLSLPAAGFSLRDNLRGTPFAARVGHLVWGSAAGLVLFGLSFVFVRLSDIPFFLTMTDIVPVGVVQRLSLIAHVVLIGGMLWVASAAHRVGEFRGVAVKSRQATGMQENDLLVAGEFSFRSPADQRYIAAKSPSVSNGIPIRLIHTYCRKSFGSRFSCPLHRLRGLLEPDAVKVASPVLRGRGPTWSGSNRSADASRPNTNCSTASP